MQFERKFRMKEKRWKFGSNSDISYKKLINNHRYGLTCCDTFFSRIVQDDLQKRTLSSYPGSGGILTTWLPSCCFMPACLWVNNRAEKKHEECVFYTQFDHNYEYCAWMQAASGVLQTAACSCSSTVPRTNERRSQAHGGDVESLL